MLDIKLAECFRNGLFACAIAACISIPFASVMAADYAGQHTRQIKSLSENDIHDLRQGNGWGLAKPAELNGLPGPAHLLELKDELGLTAQQQAEIEIIYQQMNGEAKRLGLQYIEVEREIEAVLLSSKATEQSLSALLHQSAKTLADLRLIHLSAHLKTPPILSAAQLEQYNVLRGYAAENPCNAVPEGHDPDMWKRHNNC